MVDRTDDGPAPETEVTKSFRPEGALAHDVPPWKAGYLVGIVVIIGLVAGARTVAGWEIDSTATVTRVIDGDTFDSDPAGRIRLADIDAAESDEPGYAEARDYLSGLIEDRLVYLDVDDVYVTDPYNRIVAVVYVRHNATHLLNVNRALLDGGFAIVSDYANEFDPASWSPYVLYPSEPPEEPTPLTVSAGADPIQGSVPLTVAFSASASGGTPPYTFFWQFGDGGSSALANPSHTYASAQTYTVTLTVTDSAARTVMKTMQVAVSGPLVTPSGSSLVPIVAVVAGVLVGLAVGSTLVVLQSRRRRVPPPRRSV